MRSSGAARFSLTVFGAGRVGSFPGTALRGSPHPARKRAPPSPKTGRDSAASIGFIALPRKAELLT